MSAAGERVSVEVAGCRLSALRGGSGPPLVVLPHEIGNPGWLELHERLAAETSVIALDLPGFGESERPEWARSVRDLVAMTGLALDAFGLERPTVLGLGFGGWIAAELATTAQARMRALVLAAPMGIKPAAGEIFDQFQIAHEDYVRLGFHRPDGFGEQFGASASTDQLVAWDVHREMTSRVGWKPYMFNRALPYLLRGVTLPALVVWGDDDRIVPAECGALYADALAHAVLESVAGCGHWIDMEQPAALAARTLAFIA